MKIYTFSPQGISSLRRRYIVRMSLILGIVFLVVAGVNWWRGGDNWFVTLIASLVIFAVVVVIALYRGLQQVREVWESIRVEVGDDYIARSQARIPQIRIRRDEITQVEEIEGGLCVRTADKLRTLAIPSDLDTSDYEEIRSRLATWQAIRPRSAKAQVQGATLLIVLLIGLGIVFISSSLWLVLAVGLAMSGYYGYMFLRLRHVEGIDPIQRRNLLVAFVFPVFITALKVCVLSGGYDSFLRALLRAGSSS